MTVAERCVYFFDFSIWEGMTDYWLIRTSVRRSRCEWETQSRSSVVDSANKLCVVDGDLSEEILYGMRTLPFAGVTQCCLEGGRQRLIEGGGTEGWGGEREGGRER